MKKDAKTFVELGSSKPLLLTFGKAMPVLSVYHELDIVFILTGKPTLMTAVPFGRNKFAFGCHIALCPLSNVPKS
jgi:hypothetical protein